MYSVQTRGRTSVQTADALETGHVLVVDDDRAFGGFMLAALQSRGHHVQWAGCISDALNCLYSTRYELVIIDLRLPDGSGMQFLRDATDEGLLEESAAIILTGHDFEEPQDVRVFHKPLDLDPFLDRAGEIIARTIRRRRQSGGRNGAARATSDDSRRSQKSTKIELVLYISTASEKSIRAVRTVREVLENYDVSQVKFSVRDLAHTTNYSDDDAVVFTPTLVKRGPGPRTWIVGNLDSPDLLVDLLEVSGVARRR